MRVLHPSLRTHLQRRSLRSGDKTPGAAAHGLSEIVKLNLRFKVRSAWAQKYLKGLGGFGAEHLLFVLEGMACVHHHQSGVGDGFLVPDAVAVKRRARAGVSQYLVVAMGMHADDVTRLDPRAIDPADGADSAIFRVQRETRMEDFYGEATVPIAPLRPASSRTKVLSQ